MEKKVGTAYTEYFFDTSGEAVGENNRTSWTVSVVTFQGRHLAHYQSSATYFMHANSLGSTSQATDYSGAMAQDQLYYPWGQEWNMVGSSQEKRFARLGHRDTTETGLDPTPFRMFSSTQGRWFSPDPVHGKPCSPQSFNRYAYVSGNPTNKVDPKGLFCFGYGYGYCDPFIDPYCTYNPYFGCGFGGFPYFPPVNVNIFDPSDPYCRIKCYAACDVALVACVFTCNYNFFCQLYACLPFAEACELTCNSRCTPKSSLFPGPPMPTL